MLPHQFPSRSGTVSSGGSPTLPPPAQTQPQPRPNAQPACATTIPDWMLAEVAEYDLEITPPPRTILDIGANIGAFTLRCHAKWPGARIVAFEPVRSTWEILRRNLANLRTAAADHLAVRATSGSDHIWLGDQPCTCSFYPGARQTNRREEVLCIGANLLPAAELVKIDTEGCEVEILQNLPLSSTRAVAVEYHSRKDRTAIKAIMTRAQFALLAEIRGRDDLHGVLKFAKDPGVTLPASNRKSKIVNRKLYVAIAGHFANNDVSFVQSMLALAIQPPVSLTFGWSCDPSVERARNILTANFLATDCTHILFVDSDIGFTAEDVARISSHSELVVGGLYPLKNLTPQVQWCANGLKPGNALIREDGLSEVKYAGTGFLCIARAAFEKIIAADGATISYRQDFPPHRREHAFWRQGVSHDRFLTEDWNFCQRWLELGEKIFLDSKVILRHAGRAEWPLSLQTGNPFLPKSESVKAKGENKQPVPA